MSNAFVDRVFQRLRAPGSSYKFDTWRVSGRPTSEGVGVLPAEVDVEQMASRILDVDGYRGNIDHVVESRAIAHPGLALPEGLRFYQRLKIPLMGEVHFINEMRDHGERDGWRVIAWQLVAAEPASTTTTARGCYAPTGSATRSRARRERATSAG